MSSFGHLKEVVDRHGPAAGSRFIVQMLETGLTLEGLEKDKERERQGKTPNPFFTMVGKCPRQSYFTLTGEEQTNPLDVNSRMNFKVGHAVEEAVGSVLNFVGDDAEVRREIGMEFHVNGTRISGRLDFAMFMLGTGILLETKATNRFAIKYMLKNGPRPEHKSQVNLYLHGSHEGLLDEALGQEARFSLAYLIYIVQGATKGEPVAHAWPIEYDARQAEADLRYLAHLQLMADNNEDPGIPAGYTKTAYPCPYCQFQDRCWNGKGSGAGRWTTSGKPGSPAPATGAA